jgi:glycosyltransferase involved in cell wall biosynthesis
MAVQPVLTKKKSLLILGTRGVPARHGGFETFAERLALYLAGKGWDVTVYCQNEVSQSDDATLRDAGRMDEWCGVRRVIFSPMAGPAGTIEFDWKCIRHALGEDGVPLILGYNTAVFALALRLRGRPVLMNMDGIEWKREKWGRAAKVWLYLNEWCGALLSSRLIADHPAIAAHLAIRRTRSAITMIPYGADNVVDAPEYPVRKLGLVPGRYFLSIGRIEPENSVLEMVEAYVSRGRETAFVCLGKLSPEANRYHAAVIAAGGGRVLFPGAIYEADDVRALRFHALAYCHGHTVGGTNPSLVESLGAGSAIVAHNNMFNRWVAGEGQLYFTDVQSCAEAFDRAEKDRQWLASARTKAKCRFERHFTWANILRQYEVLCESFLE